MRINFSFEINNKSNMLQKYTPFVPIIRKLLNSHLKKSLLEDKSISVMSFSRSDAGADEATAKSIAGQNRE
jgi:hypothetical protein